jgi:hypothetical protein
MFYVETIDLGTKASGLVCVLSSVCCEVTDCVMSEKVNQKTVTENVVSQRVWIFMSYQFQLLYS